jgi:hypothetical protein
MGLSSKKSKTSKVENSTRTDTPTVPDYIQRPNTDYYSRVSSLLNTAPGAVSYGPSTLQREAFTRAGALGGQNPNVDAGMAGIRGLLDYTPERVSAGGANLMDAPDRANYDAATYNAGQLRDTNLSPYMNPYEAQVVSRSLLDLDRFREGAVSGNQARATQAGAYGGSRHGVADSETNRGYIDQAGLLSSNLRSAGFRNAQDRALTDIGLRASSDAANAGATNEMRSRYASDLLSTMGANQGSRESASQRALQAALANQSAERSGADFRLGAANNLASLGLAGDSNQRANIGLFSDLGGQERDIALASDPANQQAEWLQRLQGLLGINPNALIGSNSVGSGSSTSTVKETPSTLDSIGQLAKIFSSIIPTPKPG